MSTFRSLNDELFRLYCFYTSILVLKVMVMSILTGMQRLTRKVFINPEDAVVNKVKVRVDENVERVRRAHLNDLENIFPFIFISFVYILTNPSVETAKTLFRVFTLTRLAHTFVYAIYVVPQPARAIAWVIGYAITGYMAACNVLYYLK